MIVRIGNGGHSFKGMHQYFGHDKGKTTKERVLWTHTMNMLTRDPDKARKVMAFTAMDQNRLKMASGQKMTGNKLKKPVFDYVLSWHSDRVLTEDHIRETAIKSVAALGLSDYEVLMYRHKDEPHPHVHIIANRVHPLTGLAVKLGYTQRKLSDFARLYQKEFGEDCCPQREENYQKRKEGKKTRYADPNIVEAWNAAADGKSFGAALKKKDYQLAQGRKRLVVIDPHGKVHNPARHLHGVRAKDIRQRIGNANLSVLFDAASLVKEIRRKQKEEYLARQGGDAGKPKPEPSPAILNRLQDKHLEERAQLFNRQQTRMEKEQGKLRLHYKIEERQNAIQELTKKTENPSLWRRLFGFARQDRNTLQAMQKAFSDVQQRMDERVKSLEHDRQQETLKLIEKQADEKAWLYQRGSDALQPKIIPNPAKKKERDFDYDR